MRPFRRECRSPKWIRTSKWTCEGLEKAARCLNRLTESPKAPEPATGADRSVEGDDILEWRTVELPTTSPSESETNLTFLGVTKICTRIPLGPAGHFSLQYVCLSFFKLIKTTQLLDFDWHVHQLAGWLAAAIRTRPPSHNKKPGILKVTQRPCHPTIKCDLQLSVTPMGPSTPVQLSSLLTGDDWNVDDDTGRFF